jgi:hypothetical protein
MNSAPFTVFSGRKLAFIMAQVYLTYGRLGDSLDLQVEANFLSLSNGWSQLLNALWHCDLDSLKPQCRPHIVQVHRCPGAASMPTMALSSIKSLDASCVSA